MKQNIAGIKLKATDWVINQITYLKEWGTIFFLISPFQYHFCTKNCNETDHFTNDTINMPYCYMLRSKYYRTTCIHLRSGILSYSPWEGMPVTIT